jgi:hypothetical protein
MRKAATWLAVLSAVLTLQSVAKADPAHSSYRIHVRVTGDENLADMLQSNLARELRKLDSVEVVDDRDATYVLHVVAVNSRAGFAAAVLLTWKADMESPFFFSDDKACYPTEDQLKNLKDAYQDYVIVEDLSVFTDGNIQSLASRIAAAVDVNNVEVFRQTQRRLDEMRKKRQHPPS